MAIHYMESEAFARKMAAVIEKVSGRACAVSPDGHGWRQFDDNGLGAPATEFIARQLNAGSRVKEIVSAIQRDQAAERQRDEVADREMEMAR